MSSEAKLNVMLEELKQFDFVQFTMPDIHGIPRGRLVPAPMLDDACRQGVGVFSGTQCLGPQTQCPVQLKEFNNFPNGTMRPLPDTVRPLAWSSAPKRRIGHVMCELDLKEQGVSESCTRYVAQQQVQRLAEKGLRIKSAFEIEFDVLKTETMEPLGGETIPYANLDLMDHHLDLFTDMLNSLRDSGVHVEYFFPEYQGGQYEITLQPQWGVATADDAFVSRYGVRAFCHRHSLTATFMALPFSHFHSAGFHFNHSLWSKDGQNVLHEASDPDRLSPTARHWIAGLLHHAPALTALCCPTVNCYHRLDVGFAPGKIYWNVDDRLCAIRAKSSNGNVFLENRIPSSACNPYITLAATIAAGLDGVERKLECPKPGTPNDGEPVKQLPGTLEEALDCLEKDTVLTEALGNTVVKYFITLKRDFELQHFKKIITNDMGTAQRVDKEREYYMTVI
ncbi:lengsin-like [Littorina saxatilis]|uniref:lengsin-like n=1 Tax=Littorina saxatilis TaxID=31220 RepID=UPI0038B60FCD